MARTASPSREQMVMSKPTENIMYAPTYTRMVQVSLMCAPQALPLCTSWLCTEDS